MLPPDVQEAVHKAESMTAHNTRAILNLCMPYTAQDDIVFAIERTARQAVTGEIDVESIDEHVLDANLMTSLVGSPPLDILVRTSGVHRLSDFMLWQVSAAGTYLFLSDAHKKLHPLSVAKTPKFNSSQLTGPISA